MVATPKDANLFASLHKFVSYSAIADGCPIAHNLIQAVFLNEHGMSSLLLIVSH